MSKERIQKVLARMGLASRRCIEDYIRQGRIQLNGRQARLGDRVGAEDILHLDGRVVSVKQKTSNVPRLLLYHKAEGEVCTRTDPQGRPTVFDRLPKLEGERWVAVGRLDINTTGLMLLTTDGDFANKLMHPSSRVEREYAVRVYGAVSSKALEQLLKGVQLEDGVAKFVSLVEKGGEGKNRWYHVVVAEGRNREVRRMWESVGAQVSRLIRVRFGHIILPSGLSVGCWQEADLNEMANLGEQVGVRLKRRTGLYGRAKVRTDTIDEGRDDIDTEGLEHDDSSSSKSAKRGGYLRRKRR